jgi:hypothetical protein
VEAKKRDGFDVDDDDERRRCIVKSSIQVHGQWFSGRAGS